MAYSLSVALATYNEADNLPGCLQSLQDLASEIIIVDGSSTDNTPQIARQFGAQVITQPNRKNFHINKQIAIDNCHSPWILQLDADERLTPALRQEIKTILSQDPRYLPAAYYLKRRNYFLGRWMTKGGLYPDPVIRLFQKGKARLPQKSVHELMEVDGQTGWLQNDLLHYADPTFSRYLQRSNRYTTLQAEQWLQEGNLSTNWFTALYYLTIKPLWRFLEIYFRHRGYKDGFPGFVFALYSGLHFTTSYIKYWEKTKTNQQFSLQNDWN